MLIKYYIPTPIGRMEITGSELGVRTLQLCEGRETTAASGAQEVVDMLEHHPVAECARQLAEYFAGVRQDFDLKLDWGGAPDFHRQVWAELLKIPFFGWSMARLDMIHIDRGSRAQAMKQVISQGKALLADGTWVILFPEGTRMARGENGTYQTAGTRLAVEAGAPVIPIAVTTGICWPRTGFVKNSGVVDVSIGAPIPSVGREPKELMREVEAWIETEMRRLDPEAYAK